MQKQGVKNRWAVAAMAFAVTISAGTALAGSDSPFGDDDNDYEGRIEQKQRSYFGFDLKSGGDKVGGVTAYLKYKCNGFPDGEGLFEAKGDTLPVENKRFDGVVKHTVKNQTMRGGEVPKTITVIYDVKGELKSGGEASGTIEGNLKAKFAGGDSAKCKATSDGKWKATKGKDIDAPLPPIVKP